MNQPQQPQSQPPQPRRRTNSLGCLGVLSIFCLMTFTALEVGLAWKLDARWFDRVAYWRAPLVGGADGGGAMVSAEDAGPKWEQFKQELAAEAQRPAAKPRIEPKVTEPKPAAFRLTAAVDPQSGGEIATDGGVRVQVPPGAVDRATQLSVTPIEALPDSMAGSFAGPVVDVRVGDAEHYQYQRPVALTLPFDKNTPGDVALATWENGRWQRVTSTVDREAGTVSAMVMHTSFWSVMGDGAKWAFKTFVISTPVGWTARIAYNTLFTPTGRAALQSAAWIGQDEYETPEGNFKIHYMTDGEHAVPNPASRNGAGVPNFVVEVGTHLETMRRELEGYGFPLEPVSLIRHDVFISKMDAWGEARPGGPINLASDIYAKADTDDIPRVAAMRHVLGRLLALLAQAQYVRYWGITPDKYDWMHMSSALVESAMSLQGGAPSPLVLQELDLSAQWLDRLPELPMDALTREQAEAYSLFFWHMGREQGLRVVGSMYGARFSEYQLPALDAAVRESCNKTLVEQFTDFAWAYYQIGLTDYSLRGSHRSTVKPDVQMARQSKASPEFTYVTKTLGDGGVRNDWQAQNHVNMPHLTARAAYLRIAALPPGYEAPKLVIAFRPLGDAGALRYRVGAASHEVGFGESSIKPVDAEGAIPGNGVSVAYNLDDGRQRTQFTTLVVNASLDQQSQGASVERWLLLHPDYVTYEKDTLHPDRNWYEIKWARAKLKDYPQAFKGYKVYRKQTGEPDDAYEFIARVSEEERFSDQTIFDAGSYEYTVAVEDVFENESAFAPPRVDPFEGVWEGDITLVDGSLVEPFILGVQGEYNKSKEESLAEIDAIPDAAKRERRRTEYFNDLKDLEETGNKIVELLRTFEEFARVGIPVEMHIRREGGDYEMRFAEIMWQPMSEADSEWIKLESVGPTTLGIVEPIEETENELNIDLEPMLLPLHRMDPEGEKPNVIRVDEYEINVDKPQEKLKVYSKLRWNFTRKSTTSP